MIKSFLKTYHEEKQVGTIYHFTKLSSAMEIAKSKKILSSNKSGNNNTGDPLRQISFTRNKNMWKERLWKDYAIRIVLNGDAISNKYKIEPYIDKNNVKRNEGEYEEIIKKDEVDISRSLVRFDIASTIDDSSPSFHESGINFGNLKNILKKENIKFAIVNK